MLTGREPAFPIDKDTNGRTFEHVNGMTLLQYYAGQAMQGILANRTFSVATQPLATGITKHFDAYSREVCIDAVSIAKQLINQLNNQANEKAK